MLTLALSEHFSHAYIYGALQGLQYVAVIHFLFCCLCCYAVWVLYAAYMLSSTSFPGVSASHTLLSTMGGWGKCAMLLFI